MSRRSARSKTYSADSELPSELQDEEVNNYEAEAEDELDEEQEVTRCICGREEISTSDINRQLQALLQADYQIKIDQGLFIQCDKCSVWQHGYCVGLFTDTEVPEKYWCELCKPELHVFIFDHGEASRSLYKPVNDRRKKLLQESIGNSEEANKIRNKNKRQALANLSPPPLKENTKLLRKDRKHFEDNYDEQLQKALKESAAESGLVYEDKMNKSKRKRTAGDDSSDTSKRQKYKSDQDTSNQEENHHQNEDAKVKKSRIKSKSSKAKSSNSNGSNGQKDGSNSALSRDELIGQASKPRFVNEKSTIYELRKRTGAILEWLGRSQMELEEEKINKIELFSYKDKSDADEQKIAEENKKVISNFNENLHRMEKLTEKILDWEQKFGKYAP